MNLKVVTHNGAWHADEVLAIALLANVFDAEPEVIRTRDNEVLQYNKDMPHVYVLDVGGEYNPTSLNFDHHMRDFEFLNDQGNKFSTFGLIVQHLKGYFSEGVYEQLSKFADKVDCQDNGISTSPELYWIADMNALDDFDLVVKMATDWLRAKLIKWNQYALETEVIEKAVANAQGGIAVSETRMPVDERLNKYTDIMLAVSPSSSGGYSIQSLNVGTERDFSMRCPAPSHWRGLRDQELCSVSALPGMVFCHATGFLTVVDTLEHAIIVAKAIIANNYWN